MFQLQFDDDASVEDVYQYTTWKIGLKPGRKLLLTSGCKLLDASRGLLQQVQGGKVSFVVQKINAHEAAQTFWKALRAKETCIQTSAGLHIIDANTSLAFNDICTGENLAGVTLPNGLQTLTFGWEFNQSLAGVTLPSGLQSLTFGWEFNQSLAGVTLPSSLQTLTFGWKFNQSLADVAFPSDLQTLTIGFQCNWSQGFVAFPCSLHRFFSGTMLVDITGTLKVHIDGI